MPGKYELTSRERKRETARKNKDSFSKYSSKHIRLQTKLAEKQNNVIYKKN